MMTTAGGLAGDVGGGKKKPKPRKKPKGGDKIIAGLRDAIAHAKGGEK